MLRIDSSSPKTNERVDDKLAFKLVSIDSTQKLTFSYGGSLLQEVSMLGEGAYGEVILFHSEAQFDTVIKIVKPKRIANLKLYSKMVKDFEHELKELKDEARSARLSELIAENRLGYLDKIKSFEAMVCNDLQREAEINHRVYGVGDMTYSSDLSVAYIIMKKLPPSLEQLYNEENMSSKMTSFEDFLRLYILVLKAVDQLHQIGVVHGDIRTDNICYDEKEGKMYLCDFGLSRLVGEKTSGVWNEASWHLSEELNEKIPAQPAQDVYALGQFAKDFHRLNINWERRCDASKKPLPFIFRYEIPSYFKQLVADMTVPLAKNRLNLGDVIQRCGYHIQLAEKKREQKVQTLTKPQTGLTVWGLHRLASTTMQQTSESSISAVKDESLQFKPEVRAYFKHHVCKPFEELRDTIPSIIKMIDGSNRDQQLFLHCLAHYVNLINQCCATQVPVTFDVIKVLNAGVQNALKEQNYEKRNQMLYAKIKELQTIYPSRETASSSHKTIGFLLWEAIWQLDDLLGSQASASKRL